MTRAVAQPSTLVPVAILGAVALLLLSNPVTAAGGDEHAHHRAMLEQGAASNGGAESVRAPDVPDTVLVDQDGEEVHFYRDLVEDRLVAINFVFTTCTTICPPMGATFGRLQERLGEDVTLISVSVDPTIDTPARLSSWSAKFGRRPGWTLVTGDKGRVDTVLKALGGFTPEKEDHAPLVLVGNDRTGEWLRVYGLAGPKSIEQALDRVRAPSATAAGSETAGAEDTSPARSYFTDTELVAQDGVPRRFYTDLLAGKVVVINSFFASCQGVCPVMAGKLAKIQEWLGERLGDRVNLLSITVDAENDTPEVLAEYAERWRARPGWYFLTGEPERVERVLGKLGQAVDTREAHTNLLIVGNLETGLWKKAYGLAPPAELIRVVESVLEDQG